MANSVYLDLDLVHWYGSLSLPSLWRFISLFSVNVSNRERSMEVYALRFGMVLWRFSVVAWTRRKTWRLCIRSGRIF